MLRVEFVNDRTGSDASANYRVQVSVNGRTIAGATVKGHPRAEHWTALLHRCATQNASLAGDGNQQPSSDAVDPVAPRTSDGATRDKDKALADLAAQVTRLEQLVKEKDEVSRMDTMGDSNSIRTAPRD